MKPNIVVVDDFLPNPDRIRELALRQTYVADDQLYKGRRSDQQFLNESGPNAATFGQLLQREITDWTRHGMSGRFQWCIPTDPLVFHADGQTHAGTIYLTPKAPPEAGLSLWRSKITGAYRPVDDPGIRARTFDGNLLDPTKWELVDRIGNKYNRLVLWDGNLIHSASCYFGTELANARLFWMFFFDAY
jgi:hypothetical protein